MKRAFSASITKEGRWIVAQCLEADVASQGRTEKQALDNLREALELHFSHPHATLLPSLKKVRALFEEDPPTREEQLAFLGHFAKVGGWDDPELDVYNDMK